MRTTACDISKRDFSELQKIIDNFVHKKKISSGGRKYLPLKHADLYIPDVYLKHLTLRVSLIKKMFYKLSNQLVIPSWAEILIYVLKLYGFDPKTLLRTLGNEDIAIVIKILRNQGLTTLSSLFIDIQNVNSLFQREANINGKYKKRKSQKPDTGQNQQQPTRKKTLQPANNLTNTQISEVRPLGTVRNSQSNFEDKPDPPLNYRSLGIVGSEYCDAIKIRNKMTMMKLWESSCGKDVQDFQGEISARNPCLEKYADFGISQICALLNTNNLPRESRNILSIRDHDNESRQFHNVLTSFAKRICNNLFEMHGPANSNYVNNDFITWMNISAAKTNTKGLYEKILKCTYASSELTAIRKLNRVPLLGFLNEKRICSAMQKISKAVNTSRSLRASIEFCLGAF